ATGTVACTLTTVSRHAGYNQLPPTTHRAPPRAASGFAMTGPLCEEIVMNRKHFRLPMLAAAGFLAGCTLQDSGTPEDQVATFDAQDTEVAATDRIQFV